MPKSMNGRVRSIACVRPLTYHEAPQPSAFESVKLYACQVCVASTTATRCRPSARGRTLNGACPPRPSLGVTRRKEVQVVQLTGGATRINAGASRCDVQ